MSPLLLSLRTVGSVAVLWATSLALCAQELPLSGVTGYDLFYGTSPTGTSQLFGVNVAKSAAPIAIGASVDAIPSRWAHRRRLLGALETAMAHGGAEVILAPMGDAVGNGAIHMVDLRVGYPQPSILVPTGNPAGYDLAVVESLQTVFCAEDGGGGTTILRGFSYATPGALIPLSPPSLVIQGSPAAYVNRMGIDEQALELYVPTGAGVQIVRMSPSVPHMSAGSFLGMAPASPTTNPAPIEKGGATLWVIGASTFSGSGEPTEAGYLAWSSSGFWSAGSFGLVPTDPTKSWVPAAGTEELAIVADGTDAYVYYLLREPPPGTFFIKPSAIGVVHFPSVGPPGISTILMPAEVGEPFANPAVSGTRVAFESSFGPPFIGSPPGGGEKISIVYTPLDPLGAGSPYGRLGVPGPLGGRVSTKGMDRPMWSRDGTRVMAATSHFPGAPNPGVAGLEVLEVPEDVMLDAYTSPHTVLVNEPFPNKSIIFPSVFRPRVPALAMAVAGMSFFGNVFHQGMAALALPPHGELGQIQLDATGFTQSPFVPNFPAIFPPTFEDATSSTEPIPGDFGARRTSFNLAPGFALVGVTMVAAIDDRILLQATGFNVLAGLGLVLEFPPFEFALPAGWITTTEFLSL